MIAERSANAVFLVNPASGAGSTGRRWPEIARRAAAAGLSGDVLFSERQGHLAELAGRAADGGARQLVVVGGDGSVNEVVNGIAGLADPPELAIIPRGTGWDFVRTFGIPRRVEAAAAVALHGDVRTVDIGQVSYRAWDGSEAEAVFANVAQRRHERRDRPAREPRRRRRSAARRRTCWRSSPCSRAGRRPRSTSRSTARSGAARCSTSSSRTASSSAAG